VAQIDLSQVVDDKGIVKNEVHATDPTGTLSVIIPAGTQALTADRRPLTAILVQPLANHPILPDQVYLIGKSEEIGPTGTTFSKPITLTLSYDPAGVPTGLTPDNLQLAYFQVNPADNAKSKWSYLDSGVDPTNHTVSATVSHFTVFAVLSTPPTSVNWVLLAIILVLEATIAAGAYLYIRRRRRARRRFEEDDGDEETDDNFDDYVVEDEPVAPVIAGLLPSGRRRYVSVTNGSVVHNHQDEDGNWGTPQPAGTNGVATPDVEPGPAKPPEREGSE
jgi:hypothetical protein